MRKRDITIYIDLAFCLVLLPMLIMMLPLDRWMEHHSLFVKLLIGWLYILYGLIRLVIVPRIFSRHYFAAIGLFLATILATHELTLLDDGFNTYLAQNPIAATATKTPRNSTPRQANTPPRPRPDDLRMQARRNFTNQQQQSGWFLYVLVVSFGYAVALLSQLNRQISINNEIAIEKQRAELALYKAQINPHFLFNTLNTIYGLIITRSDRAEEAFMLFTNLMKYIYTKGTADMIDVDDEIEYIEQYIALQTFRTNGSTNINFDYSPAVADRSLTIAPMLLITFVENAIKYGVSSHTQSNIDIAVQVYGAQLTLTTHNAILNRDEKSKEKGDGIGITNCRQRLQLLYPNRHQLTIDDNGSEFHVELTIQLT